LLRSFGTRRHSRSKMKLAIVCAGALLWRGALRSRWTAKTHNKTAFKNKNQTWERRRRAAASRSTVILALKYECRRSDAVDRAAHTKGSDNGTSVLEADNIDIAWGRGAVIRSLHGHWAPATQNENPDPRGVLPARHVMFGVSADSPSGRSGMAGQPVAFGAKGSGLPIPVELHARRHGLKRTRISSRSISIAPATRPAM